MPQITLPNTITDGDTTGTAADYSSNVYQAQTAPQTLDVMNGRISRANLATNALPLARESVRKNDHVRGHTHGATVNVDYFYDWFNPDKLWALSPARENYDAAVHPYPLDPSGVGTPRVQSLGLPVMGTNYLVPWGSATQCSRVTVVGEIGFLAYPLGPSKVDQAAAASPPSLYEPTERWVQEMSRACGQARLFIDGTPYEDVSKTIKEGRVSTKSYSGESQSGAAIAANKEYHARASQFDVQWWSFEVSLSNTDSTATNGGFHTVEVRLHHDARLVRVYARNLTVIVER